MKMNKTSIRVLLIAVASIVATSARADVNLLEKYPTQLTAGDAAPENARAWDIADGDVYRLSQFVFEIPEMLRVETGAADVGIGHSKDGAVWAVVIPRETGTLTSPVEKSPEAISHIWLRFHPKEISRVLTPETVFGDGNAKLVGQMRAIAKVKMISSWQCNGNAMIPEPKDMTVDADTKAGPRRFFVVDREAGKADYVAAFSMQSMKSLDAEQNETISLETAPPVVVKTVPMAGDTSVDPGLTEVQVTFSKPMRDGSWSWSTWGDENFPEVTGKIHYLDDGRTCVLPVKLQPGKFYATWLNSSKFHSFKDVSGRAAVPYLLTFTTAK
jgi:RNA polymerase sigma-70 factor (ECF subfamily)